MAFLARNLLPTIRLQPNRFEFVDLRGADVIRTSKTLDYGVTETVRWVVMSLPDRDRDIATGHTCIT